MMVEINSKSDLDDVIKYFDGIGNMNAWHCPETDRIIDAETCLECYLDALENIDTDPDDACLSCTSAKRAYNWEHRRKKVKKASDFELIEKISKSDIETEPPGNLEMLIGAHWGYLEGVIETSMPDDAKYNKWDVLRMIELHYRTSFEHGWKHRGEC